MVTIETKDLDEAAFLWCDDAVKFQCVRSAGGGGRGKQTVFFIFDVSKTEDEVTAMRTGYYNRDARVEPKLHAARLMDVRNVLHESFTKGRR